MILVKKENIEKLRQVMFLALFTFPVVSIKFINIFFICFTIFTLLFYYKEKPKFNFSIFKLYALFILPFVPYLIEFLLYPNNQVIRFELEKKLLFFAAPIVFYLSACLNSKLEIKQAVNCFISSVAILSFMTVLNLLFWGNVFSEVAYQNGAFEFRRSFEEMSSQHPIYYGLFSTTASLWIIYYFDKYSKNLKWLFGISLFFMLLLNVVIASKMPLIILILGLIWIGYKKVSSRKQLMLIYGCSFVFVVGISFLIPSLRNRLLEIPNYFFQPTINNTLLERNVIFNCSKNVFLNDIYFGVGARNTQKIIDSSYLMVNFYKGYFFHFNSHNQFLTLGINYGIGVILLFLGLLGVIYKKLKSFPLGFIYICSSVLVMFTESILERQMGIYYFLFFGLLFLLPFHSKYTTNANTTKAK
jgi:hypothetical protein